MEVSITKGIIAEFQDPFSVLKLIEIYQKLHAYINYVSIVLKS